MSETRFIKAGWFVDGSGIDARRQVYLGVQDGYIVDIGPMNDLPCTDDSLVDDLSHCTILPALVDCNVSLFRSTSVTDSCNADAHEVGLEDKLVLLGRHLRDCHSHGVQGVADNDEVSELLQRYSQSDAPERILEIRVPGRPDLRGGGCHPSTGDFLKIYFSPNIDDEDSPAPALSYEALCQIIKNRGNKKTIVVANGRQQVELAIAAGCDAIEQGYAMGEDNLRAMAEKRVLWVPNVLRAKNRLDGAGTSGSVCCRFSQRYVAPGKPVPGAEAFWKKILGQQLAQLSFGRKCGVKMAIGTGAGSIGILHGESMVEEIKLFIKAGYTLEEAIQCASEHGASFFGMENLGPLTVGRKANFLITRGTVKQLPRKLSYLEGVYVEGEPSRKYSKNPVKNV